MPTEPHNLVDLARRDADRLQATVGTRLQQARTDATRYPNIPGYQVLGEIHRGAQGAVLLGRQDGTDRDVAIKLMHPATPGDRAAARRFAREIRALGQIDHPNVVRVHTSGVVEDCPYLVMAYVVGLPLDAYVVDRPIRERVALLATVCGAVHAAHVRGIIHRDLKPSNVRVTSGGQPFVLDFGLAKLVRDEWTDDSQATTTLTGAFVGSLRWASPEQAVGAHDQVDTRSDVYALGVMLYQVLTETFPYPLDGSLRENLDTIGRAIVTPPRTHNASIDDELETIVLRCLQANPERRYQSAGELQRDLQRYLAGEPIEAKRDNGWYMLKKLTYRYPGLASSTALAIVVIIILSAMLLVGYQRARVAQMAALDAEQRARAAAAHAMHLAHEAEQAREEAERQAARTQAVVEFQQSMLAEVDPHKGGSDLRAEVLLDAASKQLDTNFHDEPQVQAQLRATLAKTHASLGAHEDAAKQWEAAIRFTLRSAAKESEAWKTAAADDALPLRDVLVLVPSPPDETHAALAVLLVGLAESHIHLGQEDDAKAWLTPAEGWLTSLDAPDEELLERARRLLRGE